MGRPTSNKALQKHRLDMRKEKKVRPEKEPALTKAVKAREKLFSSEGQNETAKKVKTARGKVKEVSTKQRLSQSRKNNLASNLALLKEDDSILNRKKKGKGKGKGKGKK